MQLENEIKDENLLDPGPRAHAFIILSFGGALGFYHKDLTHRSPEI